MTKEEKAAAYDAAIKKVKELAIDDYLDAIAVTDIFPELKESEKIRNTIFDCLYKCCDSGVITREQRHICIAWLEKQGGKDILEDAVVDSNEDGLIADTIKQGEQKPVPDWMLKFLDELRSKKNYFDWDEHKDIEGGILAIIKWMNPNYFNEKDGKQKADKTEPKFKIGDWVVAISSGNLFKILSVHNGLYKVLCEDGIETNYPFKEVDKDLRLWTIQDAKEGDVLSWDDSKCIALFKNIYDKESFNSHGFVGHLTGAFESGLRYHDIQGAHPATKEQRDLLFQKMHEAGYAWDADKKELKKIEQKPAWSEEDEKFLSDIIKDLVHPWNEYIPDRIEDEIKWLKNKLKSLKDKVQPQPKQVLDFLDKLRTPKDRVQPKQEWSGGDEAHLHSLITHLEQWIERHPNTTGADIQGENVAWLKSLKLKLKD